MKAYGLERVIMEWVIVFFETTRITTHVRDTSWNQTSPSARPIPVPPSNEIVNISPTFSYHHYMVGAPIPTPFKDDVTLFDEFVCQVETSISDDLKISPRMTQSMPPGESLLLL